MWAMHDGILAKSNRKLQVLPFTNNLTILTSNCCQIWQKSALHHGYAIQIIFGNNLTQPEITPNILFTSTI